jgi:hypothetical protein
MLFPKQMAERIIATPLIGSVHEDKMVYEGERNGCYSVKFTKLLCKVLFVVINPTWQVIGKKIGKRMLRIKHVNFFGDYVGDVIQQGVVY